MVQTRLVKRLVEVNSTNTLAMTLGRQGARAGTVVIAETQTEGRGRLKRSWVSPPGTGLYFSLILRPDLEPVDLPKITLVAGVAICQALEAESDIRLGIKWPNDLVLDQRKLGGILTEAEPSAKGKYLVILGVGLNVSTPKEVFPVDLQGRATSLLISTGHLVDRDRLFAAILASMEAALSKVEACGFGEIFDEWRARDVCKDKVLTWVNASGGLVRGVGLGLDDSGAYLVRDAAGVSQQVLSGDLDVSEGR